MSEADGTKTAESLRDSLAPAPGGRPIRKRGYHRALKRGESWALMQKMMVDLMNDTCRRMYESMAKHDEIWGLSRTLLDGGERTIKIVYGSDVTEPETEKID